VSRGRLAEVKNNRKFEMVSPKSGRGHLKRYPLTRDAIYSNLTENILAFWESIRLWSFTRGGRAGRFGCIPHRRRNFSEEERN